MEMSSGSNVFLVLLPSAHSLALDPTALAALHNE